ncbi:MAG: helix-hairpin-helix domain-containing protein [Myxococcota bacterium]
MAAGERVVLRGGLAALCPPSDPVLVGRPVGRERGHRRSPGGGARARPATAEAIVAARAAAPFRAPDELRRACGVGRATARRGRALAVGRRPALDPNVAAPDALQTLPGIGPALAARLVAERERGPVADRADLARVPGIGPATVARLAGLAEVGAPPAATTPGCGP